MKMTSMPLHLKIKAPSNINSNLNAQNTKELDQLYIKFANIFKKSKCDKELFTYLKSKSIPTNTICGKTVMAGAWYCSDCQKDSTCIICPECFENVKEKHKNHCVTYTNTVDGCCDCGDSDALDPNGFCLKHKGNFTSENDINIYISKAFPKEQITSIRSILIQMLKKIHEIMTTKNIGSVETDKDLDKFFTFLNSICQVNHGILHILCDLLIMNFPYETTHECVKLTTTSIEVIETVTVKHLCCCTFIQLFFNVFGESKKHEAFLFLLMNNYKTKTIMGLSIFATFKQTSLNQCETIQNFSVQVIRPNVIDIILKSNDFMEYFGHVIYDLFNDCLNKKNYEQLEHLMLRVTYDIIYLIKNNTYELFRTHISFYKRMIDMMCLMHNRINVKEPKELEFHVFSHELIVSESLFLKLFALIITIYDFTNPQKIDELFDYFLKKFNDRTYKQLNTDEYSFFITVYRGFSIFLNQYVFVNSIMNKIDLKTSLNDIITARDFNYESIIHEVIKFFGFVLSTKLRYWTYYGEDMEYYGEYYQCSTKFKDCDFSLIKLLCSTNKYSHLLSIESLFKWANVCGSYDRLSTLQHHNLNSDDTNDLLWIFDNDSQDLFLGQKIIELFITIQQSIQYMLNLLYTSFQELSSCKIICDYFRIFNGVENDALVSMIQSDLANVVISNGNSCAYSNLQEDLTILFTSEIQGKDEMKIIKTVLDQNSNHMFSLKPQYYDLVDLSFIFNLKKIANAERYLLEFKKKEINLLQTAQVPLLNSAKTLQWDFEAALYSKDNTEWLLGFIITQLNDKNWENVKRHYLFSTLKLIHILISIGKNGNKLIENSIKLLKDKIEKLLITLDKPSVHIDEMQIELCQYTSKVLQKYFNVNQVSHINLNDQQIIISQEKCKAHGKSNKAELLSKYKQQFQKKNKQFQETLEEDIIINQISSNQPESDFSCVICHTSINKDTYYTNPIVRFGFIVKDNFIPNIHLQIFNQSYKKDNKAFLSIMSPEAVFSIKKQMRIVTCNHLIHFSCFKVFLSQKLYHINADSIPCPFCHKTFNILIPVINLSQINEITKGVLLEDFFIAMKKDNTFDLMIQSFNQKDKAEGHDWYVPIKDFLSHIIEDNNTVQILHNDIKRYYECYLDYFKYFFVYYDNHTNNQIEIMNAFIVSLRLNLLKDVLKRRFVFDQFRLIINSICKGTVVSIDKVHIGELLIETLFLYLIIFDHNYNDLSFLLRMFIPFIYAEIFLKIQLENNKYQLLPITIKQLFTLNKLETFISQAKLQEKINCLLVWYLNKFAIVNKILHNDDSNNKVLLSPNNSMSLLDKYALYKEELCIEEISLIVFQKYPSFWPKVLNYKEIISKLFISLIKSCVKLPVKISSFLLSIDMNNEFSFISLPNDMLQFTTFINNISCSNCKAKINPSYLCLVCGRKTCKACKVKKPYEIQSYLFHSSQCGGGNTAYIASQDGEIIFVSTKTDFDNKKTFAYLNQFGEEPRTHVLSKEYQLSQEALNKAKNAFITYSYRK